MAYKKLQTEQFNGYHLLGGCPYPLSLFCMVPYRNESTPAERTYNYLHSDTRMEIEKCFGLIKRRFTLLANGFRFKNPEDSARCILACFILENICVVGLVFFRAIASLFERAQSSRLFG